MEEALKSESVTALTRNYTRCMLSNSYEPDRRYVAQYGVDRAPAFILVHHDGTYHARSECMSAAQITGFLTEVQPPGARPVINPHIPRQARYAWHRSIDEAQAVSQRTGRPVLIVFYRSFSRDWGRLSKLLSRHEVYRRFANMVHCRVGVGGLSTDTHITRFGVLRLPAIVIAHPDGAFDVLELPMSYEAVVRFADGATGTRVREASKPAVVNDVNE